MKIKFLKDCELEVIESFDQENDMPETTNEIFRVGEIVDGDNCGEYHQDHIDFQFGDGSVVLGLPKQLFEVTEQ